MTVPYVSNAAAYLVELVFGLYIYAVLLRLIFQLVRADFYNPIAQIVVKITDPALRPLRRFIPGFAGLDIASLALVVILQIVNLVLVLVISGHIPAIAGVPIMTVAELLTKLYYIFLVAIIIQAVISWINPAAYTPITQLLYSLTNPLLKPVQKHIPPIGGLDLSPLFAIVALQLAMMLLIAPIHDLGLQLL